MIARRWGGTATAEGAARYLSHFRGAVLPALRGIEGFAGAYLMRREREGEVELSVLTLWTSRDAVQAFAGDDLTTAVVEPAAQAALTSYDTTVALYDVAEHA